MKARLLSIGFWLLVAVLLRPALAQEDEPTPAVRFQQAFHLEVGEGKLEEALEQYEELVSGEGVARQLRAMGLLGAARCLRRLQRMEAATDAYRRILAEFDDVAEVVTEARQAVQRSNREEFGFRRKVEELIAALPGPSYSSLNTSMNISIMQSRCRVRVCRINVGMVSIEVLLTQSTLK